MCVWGRKKGKFSARLQTSFSQIQLQISYHKNTYFYTFHENGQLGGGQIFLEPPPRQKDCGSSSPLIRHPQTSINRQSRNPQESE